MSVLDKTQVILAMSGGVDSSVAALLLKKQGFNVIGISMKTHDSHPSQEGKAKTCCTASDIQDARRVCQQLDIPFYALDFKESFDQHVVGNFVEEYLAGRTPNPCVQCNDKVKFSQLLEKAHQLGAYYLATGHYARKIQDKDSRAHLLEAKDKDKDQTYFLFGLSQEQLRYVLFPIGDYTKEEVRAMAREAGLQTADKPESQEICFVPENDYAAFIEGRSPQSRSEGEYVDAEGKVLGTHRGIHAHTVGQRRGLGVAAGERLYVTGIVPEENRVILGKRDDLLMKALIAKDVRWIQKISSGIEIEAKIRYQRRRTPGTISFLDAHRIRLDFSQPEGAITPGQAVVFYRGEEVLGGGWIEKSLKE